MNRSLERSPWAFEAALFLLAPFFFVSKVFAILTPLPLFYLHQGSPERRRSRILAFAAVPVGAILASLVLGPVAGAAFIILGAIPALVVAEMLDRQWSLETAILTAAFLVLFSLSCGLAIIWQWQDGALWRQLETVTLESVRAITQDVLSREKGSISDEARKSVEAIAESPALLWREAVGILVAAVIVLCALPAVALLRWNPKGFATRVGIRREYLRRWASPEWLVWPSLFTIAFLIFSWEPASIIATNLSKPLILIYFFQGLSILSFYFDLFRMRGPIRVILYSLGILFLAPMIASFGFFDLWFRFRDRGRAQEKPGGGTSTQG